MWKDVRISLPENNTIVETKIHVQGEKVRNQQNLLYRNGRWWTPDGEMYVYYTPSHWRERFW